MTSHVTSGFMTKWRCHSCLKIALHMVADSLFEQDSATSEQGKDYRQNSVHCHLLASAYTCIRE